MKDPRRISRRRFQVLIGVQVAILLHVLWWLVDGRTLSPLEPSEAMSFSKTGVINAGLILLALAVLSTLLLGRWFCGWGCHLMLLQDACRAAMVRLGIRPRPFRSRVLRLVPVAAFFYMFLWPIVERMLRGAPAPKVSVELTTHAFWATFPGWVESTLTLLFAGFVVVYLLGSKAYCSYACPYGAILTAADSFAPARVRVNDDCRQCGRCTAACSSDVRVHEEVRDFGAVIDPRCMKTLDCVAACPNDALSYALGRPAALTKARAEGRKSRIGIPSWGEEFLLAIGYALGFFATHGLYGRVPFLLALAFGMVAAFSLLALWRLLRRPSWSWNRKAWKMGGGWTRRGRLGGLLCLLFLLLAGHSLWVQQHRWARDRAFAETNSYRAFWLQGQLSQEMFPAEAHQAMRDAVREAAWVERHGLLQEDLTPFIHAWDSLFSGDLDAFESGLKEVLQRRPDFGEVQLQYGYALMNLGRLEEALEQFDGISPRDPRYPVGQQAAISVLHRLGKEVEAAQRRASLSEQGFGSHHSH